MSIINKKKQRKQIKTTLQYKKNHTSHAEKCCFLLTLENTDSIIIIESFYLQDGIYHKHSGQEEKWDIQIICLLK